MSKNHMRESFNYYAKFIQSYIYNVDWSKVTYSKWNSWDIEYPNNKIRYHVLSKILFIY